MRKPGRALALCALLAASVAATGCGGGSSTSGKKGGNLTVLDVAGGIDSLDPAVWYYQTDYMEMSQTTQRALYGWPASATSPAPDLAQGKPTVSGGGKTVTVKIRPGIKYSPPLQNRTVKSADIKYALLRCFQPKFGNGYVGSYFSSVDGFADFQAGKTTDVKGLQTPDDNTIVFKTTKPVGVIANGNALSLPCTTPIPKDYAQKFDQGKQSTYGQHQVFTGPYMVEGSGGGTIPKSSYSPGKILKLVRNPSWQKSTDFRPAYVNTITVQGGDDPGVASRKILSGQSMVSGDFAAPPTNILKQGVTSRKDQFDIAPSQSMRFISLNTKVKPLDDPNFRKAIIAATDRTALRLTRGGENLGPLATHMIPPDMPGFAEAGGMAGPGVDFYKSPTANIPLAQQYLKKAGFKSGRYTGPPLLVVADNEPPASTTAEEFQSEMSKIGIKMNFREAPHNAVFSKFCGTPKAAVALCPTLAWGKDFFDSQSEVDPLLNGKNIAPTLNSNYAQVDDPKLNGMLDHAATLTDDAQRAKAYGAIDRYATSQAYYNVWLWDNQINFGSKNVKGVKNQFNNSFDLTFSSLK